MSTTWTRASDFITSERKAFPRPRPLCASGTRPATSHSFIGTNLTPEMHFPQFTAFSLHGQAALTYASPSFGSRVVKGYGAILTSLRVHALKKVLFPLDGAPTRPISAMR